MVNIAGHILRECIPAFDFIKNLVMNIDLYMPMEYKSEMQEKSLIVPFAVLFKDEKKNAEIVDVLGNLEAWIHKTYAKAGKISLDQD